MKRIVTKIGDVFEVPLGDGTKRYFQYIANDMVQLKAEFYAHCVLRWGIQEGLWKKAGKEEIFDKFDVLFRDTGDYGNGKTTSDDWYIWKINDPDMTHVGKLTGANRDAEIGTVIPPTSIAHRIVTGRYDFVYPEYE